MGANMPTDHKKLARWHESGIKGREKEKRKEKKEGGRKGRRERKETFLDHLLCARYFYICYLF